MNDQNPRPRRTCDIVMKGGITSGVIYPKAIATLAERYDFKNIGGTSAGAIAAAAAAAAQYRRVFRGSEAGYGMLENLPALLGEKPGHGTHTRLFTLFQPNANTRRIFEVVTGSLGGGSKALVTILLRVAKQYAGWTLAGGLAGLLLGIWSAMHLASGVIAVGWIFVSLLLLLVGGSLGAVTGFVLDFIREVPRNGYGLCSGIPDPVDADRLAEPQPLTLWLTRYLNEIAGLVPDGDPLTFRDLWGTAGSDPETAPRQINLEMMTTNLTHRRPYRLPFRDDEDLRENNQFYFRPDEFRRLFPDRVVQWMIDRPRDHGNDPLRIARRQRLLEKGFHPLPSPSDLPVVVPTRMSLSFPILLSAVPLHAIDRTASQENEQPERCWFSDGGMCSNFPLHFFDGALPRRPTFSIDLTEKPDGTPKDRLLPEMPTSNRADISERWNRFDTEIPKEINQLPAAKPDLQRLLGFIAAMLGTMQNWTDTTQGRLPGYRDRIVRVPLTPREGGLNLDMPPELIEALTERGVKAAELLKGHFDVPPQNPPMTWDNHRWVRLRAFLASLEKSLSQIVTACNHPENGDRSYGQWLADVAAAKAPEQEPPGYPLTTTQLESAIKTLEALQSIHDLWAECPASQRAPRPRPILRPRAQI